MVGSCTGNVNANTTYAWQKSGVAFATGTTASDTLAANTGTSAQNWTYTFIATNSGAAPTNTTQVVSVAGTGTGGSSGIDLSACTAAGYVGHGVDIAYPTLVNSPRVYTDKSVGSFGGNDMIVVRFVAAAAEANGSNLVASEYSVYQPTYRLATLSTAPCVVAASATNGGNILASKISQAPTFNMSLTPIRGYVTLTPGATYYVNYVNRDTYGSGVSSCAAGNCAMYIDFNN